MRVPIAPPGSAKRGLGEWPGLPCVGSCPTSTCLKGLKQVSGVLIDVLQDKRQEGRADLGRGVSQTKWTASIHPLASKVPCLLSVGAQRRSGQGRPNTILPQATDSSSVHGRILGSPRRSPGGPRNTSPVARSAAQVGTSMGSKSFG
jgi:hypothetical protein